MALFKSPLSEIPSTFSKSLALTRVRERRVRQAYFATTRAPLACPIRTFFYRAGAPHGLCTTEKDKVNADLLAFIKS
jgi:hypothetical protein